MIFKYYSLQGTDNLYLNHSPMCLFYIHILFEVIFNEFN